MHLVPTQDEVLNLMRRTGALRTGHFEYPDGLHADEHVQIPLLLRFYEHAKSLSVGLSRLLRQNTELRAMMPQLSLVAPSPNGLPIAYSMCEAIKAKQVYWAEQTDQHSLVFPQYIEPKPGEKIVMVDDILRTGRKLRLLRDLIQNSGAEVVAVAVLIEHRTPKACTFGDLPFFSLATLPPMREGSANGAVSYEQVRY